MVAQLPEIQSGEPVTDWRPTTHMTWWSEGSPIELIRFAGANRLKVTIDYRPMRGRVGPRIVEPYSLRYSRQGNLLVMVVNDGGDIRSYRADRIRSVKVEPDSFAPRFFVEF